MDFSGVQPPRIRVAIVLSVALHMCALVLLALFFGAPGSPITRAGEAPVFAVTTIVYRTTAPRAPARQRLPAAVIARAHAHATPAPALRRSAMFSRLTGGLKHLAVGTAPAAARVPRRSARTPDLEARSAKLGHTVIASVPLPVTAAASPPPVPTPPAPAATPVRPSNPSPSPVPSASPAMAAPGNFSGLFSQDYPPALPAPSILEAIRSQLGGHGRIRISVDETGHATAVQFTSAVADGAAQGVRAELLAATYVPADCNGLHCDGMLEISY